MNPTTALCGRYPARRVRTRGGRRNALVFALLALLVAACAACSGSSAGKETNDGGEDASGPTYAPTFTAVYNEILQGSCAVPFCHIGATTVMAMPDQASAYAALYNVPASSISNCAGAGIRVVPGNAAMSLLYEKIEQPIPATICGQSMPGMGRQALTAREIDQIKQWITLGAKND